MSTKKIYIFSWLGYLTQKQYAGSVIVAAALAALPAYAKGLEAAFTFATPQDFLQYVPSLFIMLCAAAKRLRDAGKNARLAWLSLVPAVNLAVWVMAGLYPSAEHPDDDETAEPIAGD